MQENIVILGTGFIAGYLNRGLHYLFSELRQPMLQFAPTLVHFWFTAATTSLQPWNDSMIA